MNQKFLGQNLYQAKFGVISFSLVIVGGGGGGGGGGGVWGQKIKVAQNALKHVLVFEVLKSDEIFKNF